MLDPAVKPRDDNKVVRLLRYARNDEGRSQYRGALEEKLSSDSEIVREHVRWALEQQGASPRTPDQ